MGTRIWLKRRYKSIPPRANVVMIVDGSVVARRCESGGGGRLGMAWR